MVVDCMARLSFFRVFILYEEIKFTNIVASPSEGI